MPSISYQLFSSRAWDVDETFAMLSGLGITEVEGFGPYLEYPCKTKALLEEYGMAMPTAHFALDFIEGDADRAIETARELGVRAIIIPFLAPADRPSTASGWERFAQHLAKVGEKVFASGLDFAWHNHDFELVPVDGAMPLELIAGASKDIKIELDLAWVKIANQDPVAWLEKFTGRLVAVHLKDVAPKGENTDEGGWSDVGHGILDWAAIKPAMDAAGVDRYVIEHDCPRDHKRMAARSLARVRAF